MFLVLIVLVMVMLVMGNMGGDSDGDDDGDDDGDGDGDGACYDSPRLSRLRAWQDPGQSGYLSPVNICQGSSTL